MFSLKMKKNEFKLLTLISITFLSGLCQGLLLPLLSILLENKGVSASANGMNASALYLGILIAAPFMEQSLYKFGFKPLIIAGTLAVAILLLLFPMVQSYFIWLGLRFFIGISNHVFHYATVVWLTIIAPEKKRGRYLSYYGFAFGLGFSLGPLMAELRFISIFLPFILTSAFSFLSCFLICWLRSEKIEDPNKTMVDTTLGKRAAQILHLAWFALLPPLGYGILETCISGSFPIFLTRNGLEGSSISLVLTCFFLSGLLTQLPIGRLSDYWGRKKTLVILTALGAIGFLGAALAEPGLHSTLFFYIIAGGALGSTYSLGVTYLTDAIPKQMLPTGNMLCSICFGVGSLVGPVWGGLYIQHFPGINFSWLLFFIFLAILAGLILGKQRQPGTPK
jgi:MFS family permease